MKSMTQLASTVSQFSSTDTAHMQRALVLARATEGLSSPNPQVGCVIAHGAEIVGEGAHRYALRDHAEIVALKQAGEAAQGATAYVTLEPCSHHGRTGPCAHALVRAGVARVVIATLDPNPMVSGSGLAILQEAGILAEHGLLETEARAMNDAFAHFILTHQPLVTLKTALSVDGKLAPLPIQRTATTPFWLTGTAAREEVHRLRHQHDAILTGVGTILADDPLLSDRSSLPRRRALQRIVLDTHLRAPVTARVFEAANDDVIVFHSPEAPEDKQRALRTLGVQLVPTALLLHADGSRSLDLSAILKHMGSLDLLSVLVEAGSHLNAAFLKADLVDKAVFFFAEKELGQEALPFATGGPSPFDVVSRLAHTEQCDFTNATTGTVDACIRGYLKDPWSDIFTLTPPPKK